FDTRNLLFVHLFYFTGFLRILQSFSNCRSLLSNLSITRFKISDVTIPDKIPYVSLLIHGIIET
ncbi:MAG: hypothetical protein D8B54_08595, partial [Catonella sp.]